MNSDRSHQRVCGRRTISLVALITWIVLSGCSIGSESSAVLVAADRELSGTEVTLNGGGEVVEQAVLIRTSMEDKDLDRLELALMRHLKEGNVGEVDGIERGASDVVIYLYGSDADRLFREIEPLLEADLPPGSQIIRRYGEPGARQVVEEID